MAEPKFWAVVLAQKLLDSHTYDVDATPNPTREQQIEVTFKEAESLIQNLTSVVPVYFNHKLNDQKSEMGKFVDIWVQDGGLLGIIEVQNELMQQAVANGSIQNISLRHCRPENIDDYAVVEVSICHEGARQGSGIIALPDVAASDDAPIDAHTITVTLQPPELSLREQPSMSTETPPAADAPMADEGDQLDSEGFAQFKARVSEWRDNNVRPEDAEPDESLIDYQLRMYGNNAFLDSDSTVFLMKCLNDQKMKADDHLLTLSSFIDSVAKRHRAQNHAQPTPAQLAEAERRVKQQMAGHDTLPSELHQKLVDVLASEDAAMEPAEPEAKPANAKPPETDASPSNAGSPSEALRLKEIELEIESKKLETAKLHAKASLREAKTTSKKLAAQKQTYEKLTEEARKRSRFSPREDPLPPSAPQMPQRALYGATPAEKRFGWSVEHMSNPWRTHYNAEFSNPDQLKQPPPKYIRSPLDLGLQEKVGTLMKPLPPERKIAGRVGGGLKDVLCSADYQQVVDSNPLLARSGLQRNLDMAIMIGGVADPTTLSERFRVRQANASASADIRERVGRVGLMNFCREYSAR